MKINVEEIKWLMIEQCLSLNKLAQNSRVSKATISRILNRNANPRPDTLGKISKVLKVNPRKLYLED